MNTFARFSLVKRPSIYTQCTRRLLSTEPPVLPTPPLLLKLRGDLKEAMKAKDTNKLDVLRGLLADVTIAAKTNTPFKTDVELLSLVRKRTAASKAAATEFEEAGRNDLRDKEAAQIAELEQYASTVKLMGEEDVRPIVQGLIDWMNTKGKPPKEATVLKQLFEPGGKLYGKPVERAQVAAMVTEICKR